MAQQVPTSAVEATRKAPASEAATAARRDVSIRSAALSARTATMAGEDRRRLIAEAAYFRAEQRGFAPGRELEDWLAAEIEVDALFGDEAG